MRRVFIWAALPFLLLAACGGSSDTNLAGGDVSRVPDPPTLTAIAGNNQITLTWGDVAGATTYVVLRAGRRGGPYSQLASVATPGFVDQGVTNGTPYFYVVRSRNAAGTSRNSNEVIATPGEGVVPRAPGPPIILTAVAGDAQVHLSWSSVAGATEYRVFVATGSGGPYSVIGNPAGTIFTHRGLINGQTYYYRVTALNAGGSSGYSPEVTATPQAGQVIPVPDAPQNLRALPGNARVFLEWDPSPGALGYELFASQVSGSAYVKVAALEATVFEHIGLTNGVTYFYVVRAQNEAGSSPYSNEVTATPAAEAPAPVTF